MSIPTVALNEGSPAGSAYIRGGDDRIREYKLQVRQILEVDHNFPSSGQSAHAGKHKQITLIEQVNVGSGSEGYCALGAQTCGTQPELVFTDEDNDDVQITKAGELNESVHAKTGDWMLSAIGHQRTGWTEVSASYANKFMRINATPLVTGGADTHSHTLEIANLAAHTHQLYRGGYGAGSYVTVGANASAGAMATDPAGSGTAFTGANVPAYVQVRVFQKD